MHLYKIILLKNLDINNYIITLILSNFSSINVFLINIDN